MSIPLIEVGKCCCLLILKVGIVYFILSGNVDNLRSSIGDYFLVMVMALLKLFTSLGILNVIFNSTNIVQRLELKTMFHCFMLIFRSDSVKLKRPTTKYILKSTVSLTPREPRSLHRRRVSSAPSSPEIRKHFAQFLSPDYQPDFQKNKFGIEQGTLRKREITFGSHSPVEVILVFYFINEIIFHI